MENYRQRIHIEGRCIEDIFHLPCILSIRKNSDSYYYVLTDGQVAYMGDWLCEKHDGSWVIQHK